MESRTMSNLDWSTYLGETLLEMTLATSAAMILVMLLRRPVRAHFGASVAYALWLLVPASLLAVLLPAREVVLDAAPMVFLENGAWTVSGKVQTAVGAISTIEPIHWELPLWLLGVVIAASWFAWRQWRFQRGLGKLRAADDDARLLHAEAVSGLPAVIGCWKPRIVLPADFELRYSVDQRRLMLAHERTHIRSGDLQFNALLLLLRCLFWFNPLVHFIARAFRHDQELACDQRVIAKHPGGRRSYGEAMIHTQLVAQALPLACQWGYSHPLKERIAMLKQPAPSTLRLSLGTSLVGLLTLGLAVTAWAAQPAKSVTGDVPPPPVVHKLDVDAGKKVPPPPIVTQADVDAGLKVPPPPVVHKSDVEAGKHVPPPPPKEAGKHDGRSVETAKLTRETGNNDVRTAPVYPPEARRARIEGDVVLNVLVDTDGSVLRAEVEESTPPGVFDQVSLDAVMQWKMPSVIDEANPKPTWIKTPLKFWLGDGDASGYVKNTEANSIRSAPRPLAVTAPKYPKTDASKNGGRVMLRVTVLPDGSPRDLKVVESEPHGVFDATAIAAISTWQFEKPENGKPTQVLVPVNFAPEGQ
ncbi:MAG: TonB family protein [Lysobacteraceae bacterium]|nr:TonB family protein [Xanthomonadaceae bacterium]HRY01255.1 TonB family protein [Xanthomonadaceae bacterium]